MTEIASILAQKNLGFCHSPLELELDLIMSLPARSVTEIAPIASQLDRAVTETALILSQLDRAVTEIVHRRCRMFALCSTTIRSITNSSYHRL